MNARENLWRDITDQDWLRAEKQASERKDHDRACGGDDSASVGHPEDYRIFRAITGSAVPNMRSAVFAFQSTGMCWHVCFAYHAGCNA